MQGGAYEIGRALHTQRRGGAVAGHGPRTRGQGGMGDVEGGGPAGRGTGVGGGVVLGGCCRPGGSRPSG